MSLNLIPEIELYKKNKNKVNIFNRVDRVLFSGVLSHLVSIFNRINVIYSNIFLKLKDLIFFSLINKY